MKDKITDFIKQNKREVIILAVIVLLAAVFRLYRISEYMTFLGDEGRDAIIVRRFLVYGDAFLIGPGTSIGNMYLGPLYYYFMAPALLLAGFSPVGPAVQIALLSLLTIVLIWWVAREWFPTEGTNWGALIAAFLYTIAPTVIIYSRSSWNPNIMPFFALLCVYAVWKAVKSENKNWLLLLGVSFALVLQSHYLGLLLAPTLFIFWAIALAVSENRKRFILYSLASFLLFAFLMSPLVIFDARHGWVNFEAIKTFFTVRQTTVSARPWNALPDLWPLAQEISTRLLAGRNEAMGMWTALFLVLTTLYVFTNARKKLSKANYFGFAIILIWIGMAFLGLGVYKQEIYDHYYGFFFPAPFLLIGGLSAVIIRKARIRGTWLVATALVFLTYFNLADNPLRYAPNRQYPRSVEVAEKIQEEAGGEKFNLAVIAERNYEDAYQYFLEWWDTGVVDIDPQNTDETITDQLFVVCELPREKCDPTNNAKTEVANFGWSRVEEEWEISGVSLYKLVHTEQ